MENLLKRAFSCKYMVKPEHILGSLPLTRDGYTATLKIAWPSIVEAILVSLVAAVDTMMVGNLGPEAIAAVGITNQPRFILLAVILSLNVGVTAVVARRKGADDIKGANSCLKQCLILSLISGTLLALVGILFARPLLAFAGANVDIIDTSVTYFRIILLGMIFNSVCLTINAAQRGIGNTKISMYTNITANIVNVIFNALLINGLFFFPKLGVTGAAIATSLGNIIALIMAIRSVVKNRGFLDITTKIPWSFDKQTISSVFNVSSSAMVEQVFLRIGFFLYAKMVAALGTTSFATHQICMNILNLSFAVGDGFSIAASSLVGQSLGAKRPDKAMLYASITQRLAIIASTILFFFFIFGRNFLVGLFTKEAEIIQLGSIILIIIAFTTHSQTSQVIISGALRGAGDTKYVARTSFISIAIVRPLLTWLLCFPAGLGLIGAWIAVFIDQNIRLIINMLRFRTGKWTRIEL